MALVQACCCVVRSGNVEHQHRGALVGELASPSDESITDLLTWISRNVGDQPARAVHVVPTSGLDSTNRSRSDRAKKHQQRANTHRTEQ